MSVILILRPECICIECVSLTLFKLYYVSGLGVATIGAIFKFRLKEVCSAIYKYLCNIL